LAAGSPNLLWGSMCMRVIVAAALLSLASKVAGQHDVRMREAARISTPPPKTRAAIEAEKIPLERLTGPLPGSASEADLDAMATKDCTPDIRASCRNMMRISRDALAKFWAEETRPQYRAGIALSIDRASKAGSTDWSQAETNYEIWRRNVEDPEYERRMAAWAYANRRPVIESNCAMDTWREGSRIRSRVWCW
jgi:hypothetical protein